MSMTWLANCDFATAWAHLPTSRFAGPGASASPVAVLPIFGFADHGLGLALDVEEVVGSEVLHRAIRVTDPSLPLRILPPLRFGLAPYSCGFFGVDPETGYRLIREISAGVRDSGVRQLVFLVTSPWQIELVHAASVDVRVDLGLRTYVVSLSGVGLSFHPAAAARRQLQAIGAHLLATKPDPARPGSAIEPDFRPGRWDQPPPVQGGAPLDADALLAAASQRLARLLQEIGQHGGPTAEDAKIPAPATGVPRAPGVWPHYRNRYLPALTRDQLEALPNKEHAFVILPTASIEQHGPHLPVGVDSILGQAWLNAALPQLDPGLPVWVAPPITYGKSNEHSGFPGTISLTLPTLRALLLAQARQLQNLGFRQLGIFNTHGGNSAVVIMVLREIQTTLGLRAGLIQNPYRPPLSPDEAAFGFHAGEWETSLMLACAEATVDMRRAVAEFPARVNDPGELRPEGAPAVFSWMTRDISRSGVMGDATAASRAKGDVWLAESGRALARRLAELARRKPAG